MNTFTTPSAVRGRTVRRLLSPVLLAAAVFFTGAAALRAATIGVNFVPPASGMALPAGTSAGVVPQTNWQNITSTAISGVILNDNTGAATTATLSASAPGGFIGLGFYQPLASAAIGDEWLMNTNIAASGTMTFTISSIPYAAYDIIINNLPLFSAIKYTYTVGSTSYFGNSPSVGQSSPGYIDNNLGTPFTFTQATSTNTLSPTLNSTYARFDGLTGSSVTFSITGGNGIAYLNGFQIIEVPEPSRAVLLMAGLLALSARTSRRR